MSAQSQITAPNQHIEAANGVTHRYRRFGTPSQSGLPLVCLVHFRAILDNWDPLLVDTITIDPDWLRTEYVDKRRTVPDIAAELGVSPQRVRDKARQFGIPLRPRGGASHATAVRPAVDADTCPQHLLPAFQGQAAIERVRRFIVIVDQPTVTRAAHTLGTTQSVLTSQLARLEADLGQKLIERARPNRPCELTPAGSDFLHDARRVLNAVDVMARQEAAG